MSKYTLPITCNQGLSIFYVSAVVIFALSIVFGGLEQRNVLPHIVMVIIGVGSLMIFAVHSICWFMDNVQCRCNKK